MLFIAVLHHRSSSSSTFRSCLSLALARSAAGECTDACRHSDTALDGRSLRLRLRCRFLGFRALSIRALQRRRRCVKRLDAFRAPERTWIREPQQLPHMLLPPSRPDGYLVGLWERAGRSRFSTGSRRVCSDFAVRGRRERGRGLHTVRGASMTTPVQPRSSSPMPTGQPADARPPAWVQVTRAASLPSSQTQGRAPLVKSILDAKRLDALAACDRHIVSYDPQSYLIIFRLRGRNLVHAIKPLVCLLIWSILWCYYLCLFMWVLSYFSQVRVRVWVRVRVRMRVYLLMWVLSFFSQLTYIN